MTEHDIRKKIEAYQSSDAPIEVRQEAIKKLEKRLSNSHDHIRKDIFEGSADTNDILEGM